MAKKTKSTYAIHQNIVKDAMAAILRSGKFKFYGEGHDLILSENGKRYRTIVKGAAEIQPDFFYIETDNNKHPAVYGKTFDWLIYYHNFKAYLIDWAQLRGYIEDNRHTFEVRRSATSEGLLIPIGCVSGLRVFE